MSLRGTCAVAISFLPCTKSVIPAPARRVVAPYGASAFVIRAERSTVIHPWLLVLSQIGSSCTGGDMSPPYRELQERCPICHCEALAPWQSCFFFCYAVGNSCTRADGIRPYEVSSCFCENKNPSRLFKTVCSDFCFGLFCAENAVTAVA